MSYFSEKIKELRLLNSLTQKQIADELGISQGNYWALETGKNAPSLATLDAIADYYNVFIDTLIRPIRIVSEGENSSLSEDEHLLIEKYRSLDKRDQREIHAMINFKIEDRKIKKVEISEVE